MKIKLTLSLFIIFAMALVFPLDAKACRCSPDIPSALDEFEIADHVVIANFAVADKKPSPVNTENPSYTDMLSAAGITLATVEKTYKGGMKPGDRIEFHVQDNCSNSFSNGGAVLLYLNTPQSGPPRYAASVCGRSDYFGSAVEDILYLDNLSSVKGKTRISGSLKRTEDGLKLGELKVFIRQGGKTWETTADSNGEYEIYDLPTGEYEIKPELPKGWTINMPGNAPTADPGRSLTAVLSEGRHTSKHIHHHSKRSARVSFLLIEYHRRQFAELPGKT